MAAAATILYVGDDTCHRIPVMERSGLVIVRAACSVDGVRSSLAKNGLYSAVTFHNDLLPPAEAVVLTARELCRSPLILLKNPWVQCNDRVFDLVVEVNSPPDVWSKSLAMAIDEARRIQEYSRQLCKESAAVRDQSRSLREMSARNRIRPIDYNALFRAEDDGMPAGSDDEGEDS